MLASRHLPQHHGQPGAGLRPDRRGASGPACRCSSAPTRSRRPPTSCTSCPSTSGSACAPSRPRTRSPASAPRSAPRSAARWRSPPRPGPGVVLKGETIGLAVSLELPLVICDIQRGGPSTGLPTKTEQSDLLLAMFGRNGEAPVPIVAAQSPGDCFDAAIEAVRIALTYRTPGVPALRRLPRQRLRAVAGADARRAARPAGRLRHRAQRRRTATDASCPTCATPRRWPGRGRSPAPPGSSTASAASRRPTRPATSATTPTTTTSWSAPARPRSTASPARSRRSSSTTRRPAPDAPARVLVLGWGSTYGPIGAACREVRAAGGVDRPGPPAPPQPVPGQPRRGARRPTTRSSSPR